MNVLSGISTMAVFATLIAHSSVHSFVSPVGRNSIQASAKVNQLYSTTTATDTSNTKTTPKVDMDQYNLEYETALEEWTAVLRPATFMTEEGIYLEAKNSRENMADNVVVSFPRGNGSLGLELLELASREEDGCGITIISGIVQGGTADGYGILPGDSITEIQIQTKKQAGIKNLLEETVTTTAINTECLNYDATVDAILSLPEPTPTDTVVLTLKRLRRRPMVTLKLLYPPDQQDDDITLELFAGENLRRAMLVRGVKLNDKLAERFDSGGMGDCGAEGTCATCAVSVTKGLELLSPAKTQEAQIFKKKPRWRMSCKTIVGYGMQEGELTVKVNPRQWIDA